MQSSGAVQREKGEVAIFGAMRIAASCAGAGALPISAFSRRQPPPGAEPIPQPRLLTPDEIALARTIFGDAIDYAAARIAHAKWAFFQPRGTTMAPRGTIHFHPQGGIYSEDFAAAPLGVQALFLHEMTHIWQHQQGIFLPLRRHPFCRYEYTIKPGQRFEKYGIEQQAMLVQHAFLLARGVPVAGAPPLDQYRSILPFRPIG